MNLRNEVTVYINLLPGKLRLRRQSEGVQGDQRAMVAVRKWAVLLNSPYHDQFMWIAP